MHVTLHLTNRCNMACKYCYVAQKTDDMTRSTARAAVELAVKTGQYCGLIFFGGEPLLCKELIFETIEYASYVQKRSNVRFHYKVTTNGLLLDDVFLHFAREHEVFIALSHDGARQAHDRNRVDHTGGGTFDRLSPVVDALLRVRPYAPVLMTVDSSTVSLYAQSVQYLFERGFRYLICSLNYAGEWDADSLRELKKQYVQLADFYEQHTREEDKFYLSPFEVKLASHIRAKSYCAERCELGQKQLSVAPDGTLFPCVQFVGDAAYRIGHVNTGIDEVRRQQLYENNMREKADCAACAIKGRCNHHCGCLNKQATGSIERVSPVLCAHERMLLPIADALGERLYKARSAMFLQKQYNDLFPLLSLVEDSAHDIRK